MGETNRINGSNGANGASQPTVVGKAGPTGAPGAAPDDDGRPLSELIPRRPSRGQVEPVQPGSRVQLARCYQSRRQRQARPSNPVQVHPSPAAFIDMISKDVRTVIPRTQNAFARFENGGSTTNGITATIAPRIRTKRPGHGCHPGRIGIPRSANNNANDSRRGMSHANGSSRRKSRKRSGKRSSQLRTRLKTNRTGLYDEKARRVSRLVSLDLVRPTIPRAARYLC